MKTVFKIAKLIFKYAIPAALIVYAFNLIPSSATATAYTLSVCGCVALLVVVLCFRKNVFKKYIAKAEMMSANFESEMKISTDAGRAENARNELKAINTNLALLRMIEPSLLLILAYLLVVGLEGAMLTLSWCVLWSMPSYLIGAVCDVLEARCVKMKEKKV
jgi:hypothetical protein